MADDFQENNNEIVKTNYKPVGASGTIVTGQIIQNDYLETMNGVEAQELFAKMALSDSQIRKLIHAVNNPIKSALWQIQPASDEKKDVESAALIEQILFKDIPGGWKSKLDEILTFPWHGFSAFEVVHKNFDRKPFGAYTGLSNIAYRDQRTLTKWEFESGELKKIYQEQSGDIEVNAWLESDTLLMFFNEKKGNDIGFPFLRMLYGNYKRKLLYKQLQAIGIERAAIPVPHLELPEGVPHDSDEAANAEEQLAAFTQAESAYFMTPAGYKLNYNQTGTFDPSKVQTAIKAENEEISGSLIGMFLEMGVGGNSGNQAGTGISAQFFKDGIEYIADKIADEINLRLIPSLIRLNFGDTLDEYPRLIHSGISDESGSDLMNIVTGYVDKGVIIPDAPLEDFVRNAHNLPKKADDEKLIYKKEEEVKTPVKEVELHLAAKETPRSLIIEKSNDLSNVIMNNLEFIGNKYTKDVMSRYKQLPDSKKQTATSKISLGGTAIMRKDIKRVLTEMAYSSIDQTKKELNIKKDIILSTKDSDLVRLDLKGTEVKLNDNSKLPTHVQILITKQSELMTENSSGKMKSNMDFSFSQAELNTDSNKKIQQTLEDASSDYIESNAINVQATNAGSLIINESRNSVFFNDEVIEEIASFTYVNHDPKSLICKELAGTNFATNDASSIQYAPPRHVNCKSYLRANLKTSKGSDSLEIGVLTPSEKALKGSW